MAKLPLPFTFVEPQTWAISLGQQAVESCWASLNSVSPSYFTELTSLFSLFYVPRLLMSYYHLAMIAFVLFMVTGRLAFFFINKMHRLPIIPLERIVPQRLNKAALWF